MYPDEIEAALCQHPAVAEVSVVGIPDAEWGELVTAVIVPAPGVDVSEQILKDHCAALLSPHKRPKSVKIVRELPKSHYGKSNGARCESLPWGRVPARLEKQNEAVSVSARWRKVYE